MLSLRDLLRWCSRLASYVTCMSLCACTLSRMYKRCDTMLTKEKTFEEALDVFCAMMSKTSERLQLSRMLMLLDPHWSVSDV